MGASFLERKINRKSFCLRTSDMKITAARGAIAITLGDVPRLRTLFFAKSATALLVEKYGVGFLGALYTVKRNPADAKETRLDLKSIDTLAYFLWAGLQEEISDTSEVLTEAEAEQFIRPWTLHNIFNATVMAITGTVSTPAQPGKAEAAEAQTASPSAGVAKASTSTRRRGSRAAS
jgi:hypothetical protein